MTNLFDDVLTKADDKPVSPGVPKLTDFLGRIKGETTNEREHWCVKAIELLAPHFKDRAGLTIPERLKVSCSLIRERKLDAKGETWLASTTKDGWTNIFVSAGVEDSYDVLAILLHELVHACLQSQDHRVASSFPYYVGRLGQVGKPTGYEMAEWVRTRVFKRIVDRLGPYPHKRLSEENKPRSKDGTRQLLVGCEACGAKYRSSRQRINKGVALCGSLKPAKCSRFGQPFERWCADCAAYGDHFTIDCPGVPTSPDPAG